MASSVKVGDKAPDFTLPAQSGEPVRLQDRLGERVVVLYFYPKDNTSGCTAEACAFRDSHEVFTDAGAEVIGVSSDSADKHTAFADKYKLPFTLLSDRGGKVRKGTVRQIFNSMTNISGHVNDALEMVKQLQG
jgi:peroxiredoxin Q/BCP